VIRNRRHCVPHSREVEGSETSEVAVSSPLKKVTGMADFKHSNSSPTRNMNAENGDEAMKRRNSSPRKVSMKKIIISPSVNPPFGN
jgi:hypothetical protein